MRVLLTAAATWLLLQAPSQLVRIDDHAGQAAALSAMAGLPPIAVAPASPEIRVWRQEALIDSTVGWVITPEKIVVYSGQGTLRPSATFHSSKAEEVLRAFGALHSYNGQWLSCSRVKDGWSLIVEGSDSSGRFALTSSSPNLCTEGGAHEVWMAYSLLLDATRGAP